MKIWMTPIVCFITLIAAQAALGCDLCAVYRATEAKASKPGFNIGVFEQFTHFGTLQQDGEKVANTDGQRVDSSITQFIAGYQFTERFGVQVNIPYIHRSFSRPSDSGVDKGTVAGLGDLALIGNYSVYQHFAEKTTFIWNVFGGVKFPTGSTDRLREEVTMEGMEMGAVHGHDLALGSGSYDGIIGTSLYGRLDRLFTTAAFH